jgi:hypothetical protein
MSSSLKPGIIGHWDWRRALYRDDDLREWAGRVKCDPRQLAALLSDYGANGRECNISADSLAGMLGWHRNTVKNHRGELIKRGWFVKTGHFSGRLERVSISLPEDPSHNLDCAIQSDNGEDRSHNGQGPSHNLDCALSDNTYTDSSKTDRELLEVQEDSGTSLTAKPPTKGGLDGSELPGIKKLDERSIMNSDLPNFWGAKHSEEIPPWERIDPDELTELIKIAETAEDLEQLWKDYKPSWIQSVHSPVAIVRHREIKAARRDHG